MTADQLKELENTLWQAADKLRVDSGLKASEYATPILGLIFLRFASIRYNRIKPEILAVLKAQKGSRMQQSEAEIAIAKCQGYQTCNGGNREVQTRTTRQSTQR